MMGRFIVTSVGTSLIMNIAARRDAKRKPDDETPRLVRLLKDQANYREPVGLVTESLVVGLVAEALANPEIDQPIGKRTPSAEMCQVAAYEEESGKVGPQDYHLLLASETYQGRACADALAGYFRNRGHVTVQVKTIPGLTTESSRGFRSAMTEFVRWFDDEWGRYCTSSSGPPELVFNMTGGFKAMEGFLLTVGLLNGANVYYIFEGETELIRIPRLPIRFDYAPAAREFAVLLEQLSHLDPMKASDLRAAGLPDVFYDEYADDQAIMSPFGLSIWNSYRKDMLSERLLVWPRLRYADTFLRDWDKRLQPEERQALNEALAKMSRILRDQGGPAGIEADSGLQGETLRRVAEGAYQHARVSEALRVSYEVDGSELIMRQFGLEPDVNAHP